MFSLTLLSVLAGMVLGQRVKVLALVPATAIALVVTIANGLARADTASMLALTAIMSIVGLQVGYLLGLGVREILANTRAARLRMAPFGGSLPVRHPAP